MAFDALAYFHHFELSDFPQEWLPLTYLYDPDLPLFPLLYFHELDPNIEPPQRAGERERIFGFVHNIAFNLSTGVLRVTLAVSKDLAQPINGRYVPVAEMAARSRLGLDNPVIETQIQGALTGALSGANNVLSELWQKIVVSSFGGKLPFGKCWDPVFGLARFIASWNSDGGRKGELIQLHAYSGAFGERMQTAGGIHADFYLLPTWEEFRNPTNPLAIFPKYAPFLGPNGAADYFHNNFCFDVSLARYKYSKFERNHANTVTTLNEPRLNTTLMVGIIETAPARIRTALYENLSAFNRGPVRAVLSLQMHHDLRHGYWDPNNLTQRDCEEQYVRLGGSFQSPKVMQLYAQQCFGSLPALPIDNWVDVFLKTPLGLKVKPVNLHATVFAASTVWGKLERLIWMAAQARKVHSSVAEGILWCIRYGGPNKEMRHANPFACKVCDNHIRTACPSYAAIKDSPVIFNAASAPSAGFNVRTSAGDDVTPNQTFVSSKSLSSYDEYTPKDRPTQFSAYPALASAGGSVKTVDDFVANY